MQTNANIFDPPYYEGDIVLFKDSMMRVYADTSDTYYEISGTSALAALATASKDASFTYRINDEWANSFGLFVYEIAGKANEGYDGWQYWNNYPTNDIPLVSADNYDVNNNDILDWFYGGYGYDPDSSPMDIKLHITIEEDQLPPIIEILSPKKGGFYLFGSELAILPIPFTIIFGEFHLNINAYDETSFVYRVDILIDGNLMKSLYSEPYTCKITGIDSGMHSLTVKVFDCVNNVSIKDINCIIISN